MHLAEELDEEPGVVVVRQEPRHLDDHTLRSRGNVHGGVVQLFSCSLLGTTTSGQSHPGGPWQRACMTTQRQHRHHLISWLFVACHARSSWQVSGLLAWAVSGQQEALAACV